VNALERLYRPPLALLTDLYELTMAYAAWKSGAFQREAVFHLVFRRQPFKGGYSVAAGLELALDWLESFRFAPDDLAYLGSLLGADDQPLFPPDFLRWLGAQPMDVDVDAMPEGTVVFPQEPLMRVTGPIVACMLAETALLNLINFQTLVATKAARVCEAARGAPVLEFGLRRAQGPDGGVGAARAAFVGGVAATSNVLAGKLYDIPVRGTHAHSWVMLFGDELESFRAYADALPNNCVFLVDTYDTLQGVRNAIEVGHELRRRGHTLLGVRLDSGDLAWLSQETRKLLDAGGFPEARVYASSDLDEHLIQSLAQQGAQIGVFGVGTRLATAFEEPALGGVYKLSAVREPGGAWQPRLKLSEQRAKISIPGILQVRRFRSPEGFVADLLWDESGPPPGRTLVDPLDPTRLKTVEEEMAHEDLLVPVLRKGRRVSPPEPIAALRERTLTQLALLHPTHRRFAHPHQYPVGIERGLSQHRDQLILEARGVHP
jgi:nicotinate phosphoribosyltransferase